MELREQDGKNGFFRRQSKSGRVNATYCSEFAVDILNKEGAELRENLWGVSRRGSGRGEQARGRLTGVSR